MVKSLKRERVWDLAKARGCEIGVEKALFTVQRNRNTGKIPIMVIAVGTRFP